MRPAHFLFRRLAAIAAVLVAGAGPALAEPSADRPGADLRGRLYDWADGVLVVAHRACHAPAPSRGLTTALPENSLAALDRCVALGVDMVEIDVRRTADGALVIMHDATVDRTTNGRGRVSEMSLRQFKALRLNAANGGLAEAPPTLGEYLARAQGRILVNLDVKEPIAEQVAQVVLASGAAGQVLVKARAEADAAPMADLPAYSGLAFMPMVGAVSGRPAGDPAGITARQILAENRIPAIELCDLRRSQFKAVRAAARLARVRLWSNALAAKGLKGFWTRAWAGGAAADGRRTWARLIDDGVSVIQTNRPATLLDYLQARDLRGRAPPVVNAAL
ncbi:glycerophosphodiester phosphodiesterase family protein [Caulobacter sp. BK020]|uniref:glycerophosphodiester phosphodiesterase family protein n=1 Tax=Caulobacter sp. BK020 TaxID=2512117 RepID=UPI0010491880|nr:glycerophosphodiester phosphodiesterase family protein [Caulobacter sp. BK020]TCS13224.1 glycerophosphoryl diester phosphodiesterase [Caulobacter sp. BK020]